MVFCPFGSSVNSQVLFLSIAAISTSIAFHHFDSLTASSNATGSQLAKSVK
ncbi:hypothetical protein LguiA_018737 [Lonicera macranthoides]